MIKNTQAQHVTIHHLGHISASSVVPNDPRVRKRVSIPHYIKSRVMHACATVIMHAGVEKVEVAIAISPYEHNSLNGMVGVLALAHH